jgi:hypothetical protein
MRPQASAIHLRISTAIDSSSTSHAAMMNSSLSTALAWRQLTPLDARRLAAFAGPRVRRFFCFNYCNIAAMKGRQAVTRRDASGIDKA